MKNQQVPVLIGTQAISGVEVQKYMALFRGEVTVLIAFNIFDSQAVTASTVESTIKSTRLSTAATLAQKIDQLPFTFQTTAPFIIGDIIGGSSLLLPTFEGTDPTGLRPVVLITRAQAAMSSSSDTKMLAQRLLRGTQGFENAEIITSEQRGFAGGLSHYMEAVKGDRKIVQLVRLPPDGVYLRLVAFGKRSELDKVLPSVSEIAQSVSISVQ